MDSIVLTLNLNSTKQKAHFIPVGCYSKLMSRKQSPRALRFLVLRFVTEGRESIVPRLCLRSHRA